MTIHTPGPWTITEEPKYHWLAGPGAGNPSLTAVDAIDPADGKLFEVCAVWGINGSDEDSPMARANARLIAASPELLEALKKIVFAAGGCDQFVVFQRIAEAAIAKAEGR